MAGGSGRIIGGGGVDGNVASVVASRLQVDAQITAGGGGVVTQGTIPWVIQEPLSVDDNGSSLTVDGTIAVSNFPASQTVDDGGLSLTVDGTVAVSNFPASQTVDDGGLSLTVDDGGLSLTVDGTVAVSNFPASQTVDDGGLSLTVDGTVAVTQSTSPWVIDDPDLKDEGAVAANPGRPGLAVRDDVLSLPGGVLDGDFTFFRVDEDGALWVRDKEQTMILSGSTNGQPIQLTGNNSAGAVTIHNPGAGNTDQLWLYMTNVGIVTVLVTIEFGGTGAANEIDMIIGCNDSVLVVAGSAVSGANNVRAYASTINTINIHGYAKRVA